MRHGESQEKGQEESQEEVILRPWSIRRARNFLARRFKFEDTARYQAGSVVFRDPNLRSDVDELRKTLENKPPRAQRWNSSSAGKVLGVGTGSTVNFLIDELAARARAARRRGLELQWIHRTARRPPASRCST